MVTYFITHYSLKPRPEMTIHPPARDPPPILASEHELRERLLNVIRVMNRIRATQRGRSRGPSRTEAALTFMMLWGMLDYLLERSPLHPATEALIDQFCDFQDTWELPEAYRLMFWN